MWYNVIWHKNKGYIDRTSVEPSSSYMRAFRMQQQSLIMSRYFTMLFQQNFNFNILDEILVHKCTHKWQWNVIESIRLTVWWSSTIRWRVNSKAWNFRIWIYVFNTTFNNVLVVSWWSVAVGNSSNYLSKPKKIN